MKCLRDSMTFGSRTAPAIAIAAVENQLVKQNDLDLQPVFARRNAIG
jgi:hypothetical protein